MVSSKGKPTDPKLREEVKERFHTPMHSALNPFTLMRNLVGSKMKQIRTVVGKDKYVYSRSHKISYSSW